MTEAPVVADTSGLLVLLDGAHRDHDRVEGLVLSLDRPLVVPGPVLVELDHPRLRRVLVNIVGAG